MLIMYYYHATKYLNSVHLSTCQRILFLLAAIPAESEVLVNKLALATHINAYLNEQNLCAYQ